MIIIHTNYIQWNIEYNFVDELRINEMKGFIHNKN